MLEKTTCAATSSSCGSAGEKKIGCVQPKRYFVSAECGAGHVPRPRTDVLGVAGNAVEPHERAVVAAAVGHERDVRARARRTCFRRARRRTTRRGRCPVRPRRSALRTRLRLARRRIRGTETDRRAPRDRTGPSADCARCSTCRRRRPKPCRRRRCRRSRIFGLRGLIQTMWLSPCGGSSSCPRPAAVLTSCRRRRLRARTRRVDSLGRRRSPCSKKRAGAVSSRR